MLGVTFLLKLVLVVTLYRNYIISELQGDLCRSGGVDQYPHLASITLLQLDIDFCIGFIMKMSDRGFKGFIVDVTLARRFKDSWLRERKGTWQKQGMMMHRESKREYTGGENPALSQWCPCPPNLSVRMVCLM